MAFSDGVKSTPIAYIGLLSVIVTVVAVMSLQVAYFRQRNEMNAAERSDVRPPAELSTLTSSQRGALTRRTIVDREKKIVTVGISRAMELVVKELADGRTPRNVIGPSRFPSRSPGEGVSKQGTEKQDAAAKPIEQKPKAAEEKKDGKKS